MRSLASESFAVISDASHASAIAWPTIVIAVPGGTTVSKIAR